MVKGIFIYNDRAQVLGKYSLYAARLSTYCVTAFLYVSPTIRKYMII